MGMSSPGSSTSRELTQEEKDFIVMETAALDLMNTISNEQFNLSQSDRDFFERVFRGDVDINSDEFKTQLDAAIALTRDEGVVAAGEAYEADVATRRAAALEAGEEFVEDDGVGVGTRASFIASFMGDMDTATRDNLIAEYEAEGSVEAMLFRAVKESGSDLAIALQDYSVKATAINKKYTDRTTSLSDTFVAEMDTLAVDYSQRSDEQLAAFQETAEGYQAGFETAATTAAAQMGQADQDILARQTGQQLAGISSSYAEAQKQLLGTLSQRGLADTGVEVGALTQLAGEQARVGAGALSQAYGQAIDLSDQRRLQQLGIAGSVRDTGVDIAGDIYGAGQQTGQGNLAALSGAAQTGYGVGTTVAQTEQQLAAQLAGTEFQAGTANTQQMIANLNLASAMAGGSYVGAQNYASQAAQTAGSAAQTAGTTAVGLGRNEVAYQAQKPKGNLLSSIVSTAAGSFAGGAGAAGATRLFG